MRLVVFSFLLQVSLLAPAMAAETSLYQLTLPRQKQLSELAAAKPRLDSRLRAIMNLSNKDDGAALLYWTLTNASGSGRIPWLLMHGPGRTDWKKLGSELTPQTIVSVLKYSLANQLHEIFSEALILTLFLEGPRFTDDGFIIEVMALTKVQIQRVATQDARELTRSVLMLLERAHFEGSLQEDQLVKLIALHETFNLSNPNYKPLLLPFGIRQAYEGDLHRHRLDFAGMVGPWKNFEPNSHLIPDAIIHSPEVFKAIDLYSKTFFPEEYQRDLRVLERQGKLRCQAF